ncbi:hypothetical protein [Paenibacillus sp. Leaf72]|uniref:hypothetical protein n=1 Tax=Paenibacillus sp. Leaf72 TaxID=1736234 RepID=UPI0006F99351|nr:hypothetical protein [Paenibacillus sp. Leaf72]KQN96092.1 hypothetical protein ASF12_25015 [Paenibacillus sp. Leaf72]
MMEENKERELDEIKLRLEKLEQEHGKRQSLPGGLKFAIGFVVVMFLMLMSIGVVQFISAK